MFPLASEETIHELFGKSRSELISIVENHTLTVQAWLSSRSPNAKKFQDKGIKASSTGFKVPLLNLALGCNFSSETTDEEIDKEIEEVKNFFASRNVPWYWWMNSSPQPSNIQSILEKHSIYYDGPPLPAMAASLKFDENTLPKYPDAIKIWQATTIKDLKSASYIRRISFKFPEGEALTYFEDMSADWLENKNAKLFLAGESDSQPVAMGAVIEAVGIPGIYVMATLPEHHRQGYGKAILTRLLVEAKNAGHEMITLTASNAGFGLYKQFGFHHLFGFNFYTLAE